MPRSKKNCLAIGPLSPTGTGQHWVEPKHDFPAPVTITNATVPSSIPYTGTVWNIRPGGEDHKKFHSRGFSC